MITETLKGSVKLMGILKTAKVVASEFDDEKDSDIGQTAFRFAYEPGNGTRYEMVLARFGEDLFVGIPNFRSSYYFTKAEHPAYVAEKLRLSEGDAVEVTNVINACFSDSP